LIQRGDSATISATSAVECPFASSQIAWQWLRSTTSFAARNRSSSSSTVN
jgi:ribosome modulation factor